jgi:hypothetical protein
LEADPQHNSTATRNFKNKNLLDKLLSSLSTKQSYTPDQAAFVHHGLKGCTHTTIKNNICTITCHRDNYGAENATYITVE